MNSVKRQSLINRAKKDHNLQDKISDCAFAENQNLKYNHRNLRQEKLLMIKKEANRLEVNND
ncbi:hypothetical protein [endosymbiont GvMRE of Glomus versiforme]|uniref:hypothetical protein n=1 Tax=endosymbiont GvMRE of Glomus versiforme TaxID=2039283 RepID=UPI000EE58E4B|nr:hypothetical protein [endosymbiont GvMRE of Glomus versiforme]RHZ35734.1 hypothetical protein GvMRE_Ic6g25 [endosymbiont GvMRE of Glomus versiforme]